MSAPLDLEAIQKRADAATPGPWPADYVREALRHIARNCYFIESTTHPEFDWDRYNDAQFIAHAREDVPALLLALQEAQDALRANADVFDKLAQWDMLSINADGRGVSTADAPWARHLIAEASNRARAVLGGVDETTGD